MQRKSLVMMVLFLFALPVHAASRLPQVFICGKETSIGNLGAGVDLTRYVVDTTRYPEAVCNDGTPAVFYYGASTKPEDRDKLRSPVILSKAKDL